jgi:hypothetical protein
MNHASTPCDDGDIVRLAKEPNLATLSAASRPLLGPPDSIVVPPDRFTGT